MDFRVQVQDTILPSALYKRTPKSAPGAQNLLTTALEGPSWVQEDERSPFPSTGKLYLLGSLPPRDASSDGSSSRCLLRLLPVAVHSFDELAFLRFDFAVRLRVDRQIQTDTFIHTYIHTHTHTHTEREREKY